VNSDEDIKYLLANIDQLETALRGIIESARCRMGWQISDEVCDFAKNALDESKRIMAKKNELP
jgi:uncharacterized protein YpuA (DUF1002 family)